ncbi:MAG: 4-hydroxy-tetrahydrodipicolinate reductase, partial [Planctomycetota bacterium]
MIKAAVSGALGKMGRRIVALLSEADDMELVCAIEAPESEGLGKPLAALVPGAPEGVTLETEYRGGADVVIDFSFHAASAALAEKAAALGTPIVIGTTGLTADEKSRVEAAAGAIPVLVAPN